jgi:hypothetical protein
MSPLIWIIAVAMPSPTRPDARCHKVVGQEPLHEECVCQTATAAPAEPGDLLRLSHSQPRSRAPAGPTGTRHKGERFSETASPTPAHSGKGPRNDGRIRTSAKGVSPSEGRITSSNRVAEATQPTGDFIKNTLFMTLLIVLSLCSFNHVCGCAWRPWLPRRERNTPTTLGLEALWCRKFGS